MTIEQCHRQIHNLPAGENVARYFGHAGIVTAKEIWALVVGRPHEDYVNVLGSIEQPEIFVCTKAELPRFSAGPAPLG